MGSCLYPVAYNPSGLPNPNYPTPPRNIPYKKNPHSKPIVVKPVDSDKTYEIQRKLGSGGQANVFGVFTPRRSEEYVLKVYLPHQDMCGAEKEAGTMRKVQKARHVLQIIGDFDLQPCVHNSINREVYIDSRKQRVHAILTKLIPFKDAYTQYIEPVSQIDAPTKLSVKQIFFIGKKILETLMDVHAEGIVHLDLKAENVAFNESTGELVVADWGCAVNANELCPGLLRGTTSYFALERLLGLPLNEKVDIWALALVLFELYTGEVFAPCDAKKDLKFQQFSNMLRLIIANKSESLPLQSLAEMPTEYKRNLFDANGNFLHHRGEKTRELLKEFEDISKISPHVPLWHTRLYRAGLLKGAHKSEVRRLITFLHPMLRYLASERISAAEGLKNLAILENAEREDCTERDSNP